LRSPMVSPRKTLSCVYNKLVIFIPAILVSFGGQTALNVGVELKDEFEGLGVRVLGTPIESVILTEDRELFANAMLSIGERCAMSSSATDVAGALAAAKEIGTHKKIKIKKKMTISTFS